MNKIPTTVLLSVITIVEIIFQKDVEVSVFLWILYGIFYLIRWTHTDEKE